MSTECYRRHWTSTAAQFVPFVVLGLEGSLEDSNAVCADAQTLAGEAEWQLSGRDPLAIAAASVYLAATLNQQPISQLDVGTAANVSEQTVSRVYRLIWDELPCEELISA